MALTDDQLKLVAESLAERVWDRFDVDLYEIAGDDIEVYSTDPEGYPEVNQPEYDRILAAFAEALFPTQQDVEAGRCLTDFMAGQICALPEGHEGDHR